MTGMSEASCTCGIVNLAPLGVFHEGHGSGQGLVRVEDAPPILSHIGIRSGQVGQALQQGGCPGARQQHLHAQTGEVCPATDSLGTLKLSCHICQPAGHISLLALFLIGATLPDLLFGSEIS